MAGFISGRHQVCADPNCQYRGPLTLERESFIVSRQYVDHGPVIVGEEVCPSCSCRMLFSRRLTKAEVAMGIHYDGEVLFQRVAAPVAALEEVIEWP